MKLRQVGLLPKGYKTDRLTKNQRDYVVKLARRNKYLVERAGEFKAVRVSHKQARKLKEAGYKVKFGATPKVVLETFGARKIHVTNAGVVRDELSVRKTSPVFAPGDIHAQAAAFFAKKRKGQYLMLRVSDKHEFGTRLKTMRDFEDYLALLKRRFRSFAEFKNYLYIVEVKPEKPAGATRAKRRKKARHL